LVDLHQLVVAAPGTGPPTPLGPPDNHRAFVVMAVVALVVGLIGWLTHHW
jgi:hypothetical protein